MNVQIVCRIISRSSTVDLWESLPVYILYIHCNWFFIKCLSTRKRLHGDYRLLLSKFTTLNHHSYNLTFRCSFAWDVSVTPAYEITYTAILTNIVATLLYVVSLDTFFFGVILHISACFQDLREMIAETDNLVSQDDDGTSLIEDQEDQTKRHLINCVAYHNFSLNLVQEMEDIISSSLFVAYIILIFLTCAVTFQVSQHIMTSRMFRDLVFVCSALVQLLVSTSFGTLITQEVSLLSI